MIHKVHAQAELLLQHTVTSDGRERKTCRDQYLPAAIRYTAGVREYLFVRGDKTLVWLTQEELESGA